MYIYNLFLLFFLLDKKCVNSILINFFETLYKKFYGRITNNSNSKPSIIILNPHPLAQQTLIFFFFLINFPTVVVVLINYNIVKDDSAFWKKKCKWLRFDSNFLMHTIQEPTTKKNSPIFLCVASFHLNFSWKYTKFLIKLKTIIQIEEKMLFFFPLLPIE